MYHTTPIAEDHLRAIDKSLAELGNKNAEIELIEKIEIRLAQRKEAIQYPEPAFKEESHIASPWVKLLKKHFH